MLKHLPLCHTFTPIDTTAQRVFKGPHSLGEEYRFEVVDLQRHKDTIARYFLKKKGSGLHTPCTKKKRMYNNTLSAWKMTCR